MITQISNFFFNLLCNLVIFCFILMFVYILGAVLFGMAVAITYSLLELLKSTGG